MHFLLNDPWGTESVVGLRDDEARTLLDQIPLPGLMKVLFQELITAPPIKLIPKRNLPLTLCRKRYERKLLVQDDIE